MLSVDLSDQNQSNFSFSIDVLETGDKPHACELCNKRFALACNLRAHMKTHEGTSEN